jgi:hypothetical protein
MLEFIAVQPVRWWPTPTNVLRFFAYFGEVEGWQSHIESRRGRATVVV